MTDALLHAILEAALATAGAARGRLVALDGGEPRLVAGDTGAFSAEALGFALASGEPLALVEGGAAMLCVPCGAGDDVVGALELADDAPGRSFSLEEIERTTRLAAVAGAALARAGGATAPPSPAELAAAVARLAERDPGRYATVAPAIGALAGHA